MHMLLKLLKALTLLLLLLCFERASAKDFHAKDGVLDLQGWYPKDGETLKIQGEWWAFPRRALTEEDIRSGAYRSFPHLIYKAPGDIKELLKKEEGHEIVSFLLHINNLQRLDTLAVEYSQFLGTHQSFYWLPDSNRFIQGEPVGQLPIAGRDYALWMRKYIHSFDQDSRNLVLAIHFSPRNAFSGLSIPIVLGNSKHMAEVTQLNDTESAFILGVFALLFLNNLILFSVRRKDRASLCLAMDSLILFLRYASTENYFCRFTEATSDSIAHVQRTMMYLCTAWSTSIYGFFLAFAFNLKRIIAWNLIGFAIGSIPAFMYLSNFGSPVILGYFCLLILFFILVMSVAHCSRNRHDPAHNFQFVVFGLVCLIAAFANDIFVATNLVDAPFLGHYGMLVFTIFQTIIVARNFAKAHNTAERLSRHLQVEVDRQTEKLRLQKEKLEEQQKVLSKIHDELKENDEQKTRFFRSISHELRTPLTMILGSLHETDDVPKLKNSVNIATRHAKRLYRLVNQLLDFQKIALSKIHLRLERVDLETFLPSLAEYVKTSCQNQGIAFSYEINSKVQGGWIIQAQVDALEKILFNYIGNAMKFTLGPFRELCAYFGDRQRLRHSQGSAEQTL
jgi:signal transduction histidine kinase